MKPPAISANPTERPRCSARPAAFTSPGRTTRPCAWMPTPAQQTRSFHFGDWKAPAGPPTVQGDSVARGKAGTAGSLKVTTSHLKAGYLRKNGVPFSENAVLTEYYDMLKEHTGDVMMVVTTVVNDPMYLREPFIVTTHFKKQASEAGWKPTACSAKW